MSLHLSPGSWSLGVSGGADSVALLHLLRQQSDLQLTVVHLNHQTRGNESDADANFVRDLCRQLNIPCQIETRSALEAKHPDLPANPSARYRRLRFALFREVVKTTRSHGVILAHHADDQAETVLQRLLRGAGFSALAGMSPRASVNGVSVVRPLLNLRRAPLREYLAQNHFAWREDASNQSPKYLRNRLRAILCDELTAKLLDLSQACAKLRGWTIANASTLKPEFRVDQLADLPMILARRSAGEWLREIGADREKIDRETCDGLIEMCRDAATPARRQFPGRVSAHRRSGIVSRDRRS